MRARNRESRAKDDTGWQYAMNQNIRIEPLLLTTTRVQTFTGAGLLTSASGFCFEREGRLSW